MPYKKLTAKNAKTSLNKEKDKIVLFTTNLSNIYL